jgi:hypothetical protein
MALQCVQPCRRTAPVHFWDAFRALAASRVRECNAIAGTALWETLETAGVDSTSPEISGNDTYFLIRSRHNPGDFLECSLDPESGAVLCRPGPAIRGDTLRLSLLGAGCSWVEAVTKALDQLVSLDQQDWEPGEVASVKVS